MTSHKLSSQCIFPAGPLLFATSLALAAGLHAEQADQVQAAACLADRQAVVELTRTNYSGYHDKIELDGGGIKVAEDALLDIESAASCPGAIEEYLSLFRDGHLKLEDQCSSTQSEAVEASSASTSKPRDLSWRSLSSTVAWLTIPSFVVDWRQPLIQLIGAQEETMQEIDLLVLDLRGNGGGSDSTFDPLLPLIYDRVMRRVGADVLVTPDNIGAWERVLDWIPPAEEALRKELLTLIGRMRAYGPGFMRLSDDETIHFDSVLVGPQRVAVIVDQYCASSCESFLLLARQSGKVTLLGQPSSGVLDYGDMRWFPLPSGCRILGAATTRSRRLPDEPVDPHGIAPEVDIPMSVLRDDQRLIEWVTNWHGSDYQSPSR